MRQDTFPGERRSASGYAAAELGAMLRAVRPTIAEQAAILKFRKTPAAPGRNMSHPTGPIPAGMQAYQVSRPVGPKELGIKHTFNVVAAAPGAEPYARFSSGPSREIFGKLVDHPDNSSKTGRDDRRDWLLTGNPKAAAQAGVSMRPIDAPPARVVAEGRALADRLGTTGRPGKIDYDLVPMTPATADKIGLATGMALGPVAGSLAWAIARTQTDGANSNSSDFAGAQRSLPRGASQKLPATREAP